MGTFSEEIFNRDLHICAQVYDQYFIFLVQGKKYFECVPNYGIFVRQTKLKELKSESNVEQTSQSPKKRITSPSRASKAVGLARPVSKSQTSQLCLNI